MNDMNFSHEAEEMHAGAMDYEMARELARELSEGREAMEEARGNDGVRVPGWETVDSEEMAFA